MSSFWLLLFASLLLSCSSLQSFLSLEDPKYNTTLATKFWNLCMASYCKTSRIANWDLGFVSSRLPGMTDITVAYNTTGNAMGFTAYYPAENEIIFVFRGTEMLSIKNWIDDLDFFSMDYPDCPGCRVHGGFYKTYLNIKGQILKSGKALHDKYPNARKLVTGHSLGGALAVHASIDILKNFGPIDEFYTYGQPRVGNTAFAQYFNVMAPGFFHSRITHNTDPVPHLPLINMGFFHVDREIYYSWTGSYQICNPGEDTGCSNGNLLNLNILDHLSYMGQDLLPYMIACNL